jgi:hypothetical protein
MLGCFFLGLDCAGFLRIKSGPTNGEKQQVAQQGSTTADFAVRVFSVWPGQIRVRRSDGILIRSMIRPQRSICSGGLRPAALTRRYNNSTASLMAREKTRTAKSAVRATSYTDKRLPEQEFVEGGSLMTDSLDIKVVLKQRILQGSRQPIYLQEVALYTLTAKSIAFWRHRKRGEMRLNGKHIGVSGNERGWPLILWFRVRRWFSP